jgi:hypothetical protein
LAEWQRDSAVSDRTSAFLPVIQRDTMQLLRSSAVVLACLMLGGVAIRADELPHDLQMVRSLTPEEARRLVEEFKLHGSLPGGTNGLYLRGLTTLSADTAAALAEFTGPFLELDRLTSLDARTAKALARYQGHLSLNGVTELPEETAKSLAESRSEFLFLNGLSSVSAAAAAELAGYNGKWLYLDGLSTMPGDGAEALGRFGGEILSLQGLAELSPEAARGLATYTGPGPIVVGRGKLARGSLRLAGLTALPAAAAEALAGFGGESLVIGIPEITPEAARALARYEPLPHNGGPGNRGILAFPNLNTMSPEAAGALAESKCRALFLGSSAFGGPARPRAMRLDASALRALAGFKGQGKIHIGDRLQALSLEAAEVVASSAAFDGRLMGLRAFVAADSAAVAKALATRKGPLSLPNLKKISPKTLTALIEKRDVEIPPIETLELIPEPDGSRTEDFIIPDWLDERKR